jgi:hypothetical protein
MPARLSCRRLGGQPELDASNAARAQQATKIFERDAFIFELRLSAQPGLTEPQRPQSSAAKIKSNLVSIMISY